MRITNVSTAVIAGNFPWVLVKIETDGGVSGLGEAYWGAGVAEDPQPRRRWFEPFNRIIETQAGTRAHAQRGCRPHSPPEGIELLRRDPPGMTTAKEAPQ